MTYTRIPARQMLRRAALIVALLIASSTAVAGMSNAAMSNTLSAPAPRVTRVLSSDRAIMLLESRDPANAGFLVVFAQGAPITTKPVSETELNHCLPCDILV